jgi:hypothetical protein
MANRAPRSGGRQDRQLTSPNTLRAVAPAGLGPHHCHRRMTPVDQSEDSHRVKFDRAIMLAPLHFRHVPAGAASRPTWPHLPPFRLIGRQKDAPLKPVAVVVTKSVCANQREPGWLCNCSVPVRQTAITTWRFAEQRSKLDDMDCERRLIIPHRAVIPPSTNSRAPVM